MPKLANVYNVMIASPGDVQAERNLAREVVYEWNSVHAENQNIILQPVGWETHSSPIMGDRPQAILNKQILADSDLLVAIFWTRIGTPTGVAASGTVEEIEEHIQAGKPASIYFSNAPIRPDEVDQEQYKRLKEFKDLCKQKGLIETFDSPEEFRRKFTRQLAKTISDHAHFAKNALPAGSQAVGPAEKAIERGITALAVFHRPSSLAVEVVNIGREKIIINKMEASFENGEKEITLPQLARLERGNLVRRPIELNQRGDIQYLEEINNAFHQIPIELVLIDTLGTRYPVQDLEKAKRELDEYPLSPKKLADGLRKAIQDGVEDQRRASADFDPPLPGAWSG